MSYIKDNLLPGEEITYKATMHWIIYVPAALGLVIGLLACIIETPYNFRWVGFMVVVISLLQGARNYIDTIMSEFAVTNKRLIIKMGWISRTSVEMNLSKVESIVLDQSVPGRLLNYGTLYVQGVGSGLEPISDIDDPLVFRKQALAAIEAAKVNNN